MRLEPFSEAHLALVDALVGDPETVRWTRIEESIGIFLSSSALRRFSSRWSWMTWVKGDGLSTGMLRYLRGRGKVDPRL